MARALIVLAVLFAVAARADEDENSWCALTGDAAETPMKVDPETKRCSARVCVGTFYRNMGFGELAVRHLVASPLGNGYRFVDFRRSD